MGKGNHASSRHVSLGYFGTKFVVIEKETGKVLAEFSTASKPNSSIVYAEVRFYKCPWLPEEFHYSSGYGSAGGYGYDRSSSALAEAFHAIDNGTNTVLIENPGQVVFVNSKEDRDRSNAILEANKGTGKITIYAGNGLSWFADYLNKTLPEGFFCVQVC